MNTAYLPPTMSEAEAMLAAIALVSACLATIKPLIESLPFARPGAPLHDATLRALNLALNLSAVLLTAWSYGPLDLRQQWLTYLLLASGQAVGSHVFYRVVASSHTSTPASPQPTSIPSVAANDAPRSTLPQSDL